MNYKILTVLAASCFLAGANVQYQDCGSLAVVLQVRVPFCSFNICVIQRGRNTTFEFDIINEVPVQTLTTVLYADDIEVDDSLIDPDTCKYVTQGSCPLGGGEFFTYKLPVYLDRNTTVGDYDLTWNLLNEDGGKTACVKFGVSIIE